MYPVRRATAIGLRSFERPAWLPAAVWPFDLSSVEVDGLEVTVTDIGRGPTLLFYTGIGSFVWRDVMRQLSGSFRCITLDPPGIGLSRPISPREATLRRSAAAVTAVIDALQLRDVTLVIHDSGGPPALAAAARRPERIRGLVGVNTFGWRPSGTAFRGMLAVMGSHFIRRFSVTTGALAWVTATPFGTGRHLDAADRQAYRAGFRKSMRVFHDYLRDARDSDLYEEIAAGLEGPLRHLPLLTIFGERNDPLHFQPRWKALFPAARQVVIPKGNHFPMCDAPDVVSREIGRWYRDCVLGSGERRP
jgi:pimeloyl-ACP methyl ester carboxylesterase